MVNRVMEAKEFKLQRQIRKLPRILYTETPGVFTKHSTAEIPARLKAEGVVAPRQPNSELMKGYKHRAASLAREDKPGKFAGQSPGDCVSRHLQRIEDHYDADKSFTILSTRVHRARVFFNAPRTVYILLYENFYQQIVRSSFPHCDKKELVDKFKASCLVWVEFTSPSINSG